MNKKGFFGKIFLGIVFVILLIGAYVGFSFYQAYSAFGKITSEVNELKSNIQVVLDTKDCTKVDAIYANKENIFSEIGSVCANPLLKWSIRKISAIPVKCENKTELEQDINDEIKKFEDLCNSAQELPTLPGNISVEEMNITLEDIQDYTTTGNISVNGENITKAEIDGYLEGNLS